MKVKPSLFVSTLAVVIFSIGCRKKLETFHLKPETLSYCNFKPGSFWVYQDQFGKVDTIKCERYSRGFTSKHLTYEQEYIFMWLNETQSEQLRAHEVDVLYDRNSTIAYHSLPVGSTHSKTTYTEKLDSLEHFKGEIKHFVITAQSGPDSIRVTEEYRMKNVGVLRRILKDGRQQDLIDYKVIQD